MNMNKDSDICMNTVGASNTCMNGYREYNIHVCMNIYGAYNVYA